MIRRFFTFVIVALAVAVPASVASAKPFKAKLDGTAHLSPGPAPNQLLNHETGEGNATHLGKFQWEDDELATFTSETHVVVVGTFTMTAANGDKVFGVLSTEGDLVDGALVISGTYQVTGGTGRFLNATGSGDLDAVADPGPPFGFSGTFLGTLNY